MNTEVKKNENLENSKKIRNSKSLEQKSLSKKNQGQEILKKNQKFNRRKKSFNFLGTGFFFCLLLSPVHVSYIEKRRKTARKYQEMTNRGTFSQLFLCWNPTFCFGLSLVLNQMCFRLWTPSSTSFKRTLLLKNDRWEKLKKGANFQPLIVEMFLCVHLFSLFNCPKIVLNELIIRFLTEINKNLWPLTIENWDFSQIKWWFSKRFDCLSV